MAYTTVGINVKVEGGKQFQSEMKAAAAEARLLDTQLKNLVSSLDDSETGLDGAREAIDGYKTKIKNCQTVIDKYNAELKRQKEEQDGTKESIANCKRTITNWTNEQNKAKLAIQQLNKYLKEHSSEITTNKEKLEKLETELKSNTQALKNNQIELSNNKKSVKLLTEQRKLLQERSELLSAKESALKEKIKLTSDAFGKNSQELKIAEQEYQELSTDIVTNTQKLKTNYSQVVENTNAYKTMGTTMASVGTVFTNIGNGLSSLGTKLTSCVTTPLIAAGTAAVKAASDVQQYQNQFTVLTGSAEVANSMWEQLVDYGLDSPFDVTGLADAAKQLLAFGFSGQEAVDTLHELGEAAMGDATHLYNIARAYGQIVSSGKISKKYLNAMVNNDFSPYLALADYYGTSVEKIQNSFTDSSKNKSGDDEDNESTFKITVEDLSAAIEQATTEGGRYYGSLAAMTNTLTGQITNLKEAFVMLGVTMGTPFLEPLKNLVVKIADFVDRMRQMDEAQVKAIAKMAMFAAGIGPVLIALGKLSQGIGAVSMGFSLFYNMVGKTRNGIYEAFNLDGIGTKTKSFLASIVNIGKSKAGKIAGIELATSMIKGVEETTLKEKLFNKIDTTLNISEFKNSLSLLKSGTVETTKNIAAELNNSLTSVKSKYQQLVDKINPNKILKGKFAGAELLPTSTMSIEFDEKPVNKKLDLLSSKLTSTRKYLSEYKQGWVEDFKQIGSNIASPIKSIGKNLTGFKNSFMGVFGPLASGIASTLSTVASTTYSFVKFSLQKLWKLFIALLGPAVITTAIVALFGVVGSKFYTELHKFATKMYEEGPVIIYNFFSGITSKIDTILVMGRSIITDFLGAISQCIPFVLQGGGKVLLGLAEGMREQFPFLVESALGLITALVTGLADNLHYVVSFAVEIVLALVNGIVENIPQIVDSAVDIITSLVNALVTNIPILLEGAIELVRSLAQGLSENAGKIVDGVIEIICVIVNTLIEHGPEILVLGAQLVWELIKGLGSVLVALGQKAMELGAQILTSIWEGITGGATELLENIGNFCGDMLDGFKSWLGINSPSEETEEDGKYLAEGLENGLENNQVRVEKAAKAFADTVLVAISDTLKNEEIDVSINFSFDEEQITASLESIKQIATTKYAEINNVFKTSNESLAKETEEVYSDLAEISVDTIKEMVNKIITVVTFLKMSFGNLFGDLAQDAVDQITYLSTAVVTQYVNLSLRSELHLKRMLNAATSKFTRLKTECVLIVAQMVKLIETTISNLPSKFNSIGQKMIEQLKKGITDSKQSVIDETSNLVKKLVDVFIKGLGIHSPARKMVWIGKMMIAGLMKGLSNSQLMKFTSNTVDKLEEAFANGNLSIGSTIDLLKSGGVDALIEYLNTKSSSGSENTASASSVYPLEGGPYDITSWFGARPASDTNGIGSTNHGGIDIGAGLGTLIKSMASGTVTLAGYNGGYGNCVIVDHGNGLESLYGHMNSIAATVGQKVSAGQSIGQVGSTGNSTGPHLHFEVRQNGTKIDPLPYLEGSAVVSGNTLASALSMAKTLMEGGMTKEQINAMGSNIGVSTTSLSGFYADNATVTSWISQAMALTGEAASSLNYLLAAVKGESNGNPYAINDWDSNAAAGTPSKGIMQTIQPTFDAYKIPGLDDIFNPVHNIVAAIRYMRARYGSVAACCIPRMNGWYGYKVGTRKVPYDMLAEIHQGEAILPANQNPYSESGGDYLSAIVAKVLNKATDIANKNVGYVVATNADRSGILNTRVSSDMSKEAEERRLERIVNVTAQGMAVPSKNETNYQITQNFDTHNPTPSEIARSTKNMIRKLNR